LLLGHARNVRFTTKSLISPWICTAVVYSLFVRLVDTRAITTETGPLPPLLAIATRPVAARHRATHRGRHYTKHSLLPPTSVGFAAHCLTGILSPLIHRSSRRIWFLASMCYLRASSDTQSSLLSDHETYLTERCRPELAVRIVKWRSPVSFSTTMTVIMWLLDEDALPELRQRTNAEM
jgi:hypothetical protein